MFPAWQTQDNENGSTENQTVERAEGGGVKEGAWPEAVCGCVLLTSSFRLLTSRTPLEPVCPARATLPAAAAAAAAALRGFRAPGEKGAETRQSWRGEQHAQR